MSFTTQYTIAGQADNPPCIVKFSRGVLIFVYSQLVATISNQERKTLGTLCSSFTYPK